MYKSRRFRLKPTAFVFLCQPLVSGVLIRNRDLHICFYSRTRPCLCILRETNGSPMGWQRILPRHGRIWNPPLRVRVSCLTVGTGVPDSPSQESHIHCRAGACSRRRPNFIHPPAVQEFSLHCGDFLPYFFFRTARAHQSFSTLESNTSKPSFASASSTSARRGQMMPDAISTPSSVR